MKTYLKHLCLLGTVTVALNMPVWAADATNPTQLETTPPPPEGALTPDQTPPILSPDGSDLTSKDSATGATSSDKNAKPAH